MQSINQVLRRLEQRKKKLKRRFVKNHTTLFFAFPLAKVKLFDKADEEREIEALSNASVVLVQHQQHLCGIDFSGLEAAYAGHVDFSLLWTSGLGSCVQGVAVLVLVAGRGNVLWVLAVGARVRDGGSSD